MMRAVLVAFCAIIVVPAVLAQSDDGPYLVESKATSNVPLTAQVKYSCSYFNLWTKSRHYSSYPTNSARLSPAVLVAHNSSFVLWGSQRQASEYAGLKQMAERGEVKGIVARLKRRSMGKASISDPLIISDGDTQQRLPNITMPVGSTLLSSIRRLAPSPDWFTGFADFQTANTTTQTWLYNFSIKTFPWDAGTESGAYYDVYNDPEPYEPDQLPISRFTSNNIRWSDVFVTYTNDNSQPIVWAVGRWDCKLMHGRAKLYGT